MNITDKDINMLLVFKVVMEERNASRAAERLYISQPALSHSLNKLRRDFNDPLFVRNSRGLSPTPKAFLLAEMIHRAVDDLEAIYKTADETERSYLQQERVVRLYTTDYMQAIMLPKLIEKLYAEAPSITLVVQDPRGKLPRKELETGECDIAIAGYFSDLPQSYFQQKIITEKFVTVMDESNPYHDKTLSLDRYLACPHIITTLSGDLDGIVDKELRKIDEKRRIIAGVPSFLATADLLIGSKYLLTCLYSLGNRAVRQNPSLIMQSCPIPLPEVSIYQVWHSRTQTDKLMKWVRNSIYEIMQHIGKTEG